MSRGITVLFLLVTIFPLTFGQDVDSLKSLVDASDRNKRIQLLHQLSSNLRWSQPDQALSYAKEALELSRIIGNVPLEATSNRLIGGAHYYLGNYDSSLVFSERSLQIAQAIGDSALMITNLNSLGIDNYDLGNYEASMQYFLEAVDLMNTNKDQLQRAIVLNNIGLLFERVKDYEKARSYSEKGLKIARKNNNRNVQIYAYNGIGNSYLLKENYQMAKRYLDSAQQIAHEVNNRVWGSVAHNFLGEVYRQQKEYDSAAYHFNYALSLSQSISDQKRVADVYTNLAKLCLDIGNLEKCLNYLDQSQELASTYHWRQLFLDNLLLYAEVYRAFGMNQKVIESQASYVTYRDSIYSDIMGRNLEMVPLKISEQKDRIRLSQQQSALKEQQFANRVYLSIILVGIPVAVLLLYLLRKNRKQNRILAAKNAEIKEAQRLLVQSEKMASLGVLAAGIGHEINNPLNYIENGVRSIHAIIDQEYPHHRSKSLQKFVGIVNEGVSRATSIVNSLANFSRSDLENTELCDLEVILESCLVILSSKTKGIRITKAYHQPPLLIKGNESKLHQVCMNLLSNAIHAVKDQTQPEISIEIKQVDHHVSLIICDNGYGIDEANLSKINDPFFTTKNPGEGTGLGLFIAHSFIDEHNGCLNVSSIKGNGATFTLRFPITNQDYE